MFFYTRYSTPPGDFLAWEEEIFAQENGDRRVPFHRQRYLPADRLASRLLRLTHERLRRAAFPSSEQYALEQYALRGHGELAMTLGEAHATVHRELSGLLSAGVVGRVSHITPHMP